MNAIASFVILFIGQLWLIIAKPLELMTPIYTRFSIAVCLVSMRCSSLDVR